MSEYIFCVGDRVECIESSILATVGERGTVCELRSTNTIGISFDNYNPGRHDCGGNCKDGHGRYMPRKSFALIQEDNDKIDISDFDLGGFYGQ